MGVSIVPEMAVEKRSGCRFVRIADAEHRGRLSGGAARAVAYAAATGFFGALAAAALTVIERRLHHRGCREKNGVFSGARQGLSAQGVWSSD